MLKTFLTWTRFGDFLGKILVEGHRMEVIVSALAVSFVFLTYINGMHIVGKPSIVLFFNKVVPNNFL